MKKINLFLLLIGGFSFAQVGINTQTPQKTLHVNGSLQFTNELNVGGDDKTAGKPGEIGQILTSNGASISPEWKSVNAGSVVGDLKYSFLSNDHNGWIKLDGRSLSSLSSSQQSMANSLGFSNNIPDATNSYFVQNGTTLGSISSSNNRNITQNQLPNVTLPISGSTNSAGNHSHSYVDRGDSTTSVSATNSNSPIADNTSGTYNTSTAGAHTHSLNGNTSSINGGVSQVTLDVKPQSLSANAFLFLGN